VGYYTHVLTKRADWPTLDQLQTSLQSAAWNATLSLLKGDADAWSRLALTHPDGTEIAHISRFVVAPGSPGSDQIANFIKEIAGAKPATAVAWLTSYLPAVRVVYAFQHFVTGTRQNRGDEMLRFVKGRIWSRGAAIIQADGEGFTNEDSDHILWQFSDGASGPWWMAVLRDGQWVRFRMELGDRNQRAAFLEGRIPPGVKIVNA
jgi:hypothetical protein